jgi:acyl-coenzyme A thioesterase PaaI-like protein
MEMPFRKELSFTEGAFQAGPIGTLLDFTAGSAAATLLPPGWGTSTIDFTVNMLAPARGEKFIGRGAVASWGKSISVGEAKVFAIAGSQETLCATGLVTMRNFPLG